METSISNKYLLQIAPASGKECISLELPKQDIEFLYKLFVLYCYEPKGEFYPTSGYQTSYPVRSGI